MTEEHKIQRDLFSPRQRWFLGSPEGPFSGGRHFILTTFLVFLPFSWLLLLELNVVLAEIWFFLLKT